MTRPRAADDFAAIRSRLEELRREREAVLAASREGAAEDVQARRSDLPRLRPARESGGLLPSVRRALIRQA